MSRVLPGFINPRGLEILKNFGKSNTELGLLGSAKPLIKYTHGTKPVLINSN